MGSHVLFVDDDESLCRLVAATLESRGHSCVWTTRPAEGLNQATEGQFDVVLTDLQMEGMSGLELCRQIAERRPHLPVVVLTAHGRFESAVEAIRAGAYDFVTKPPDFDALELLLARAKNHKALRDEVKRLQVAVETAHHFGDLVGDSAPMKQLYALLERVAGSDASVLVAGETGTGKELVARALHRGSRRTSKPFVAINCSAMPEQLLEAELFGHTKGAFTGAHMSRKGLFQTADGGTLFLDEVGELPLPLQPKLLRVLQERRVRPVGGEEEIPVDVRIVAASHRDLLELVERGQFRQDLYFRLDVVQVRVPSLRERKGDILLLAQHFLRRFAQESGREIRGIDPQAGRFLRDYAWPGNVRELQNVIERAVTLTMFDNIGPTDLPERVTNFRPTDLVLAGDDPSEFRPLEEVERQYIDKVVASVGGNKTQAAQLLGIDRSTLYRKLERNAAPRTEPTPKPSGVPPGPSRT